jgi:hypothetical protein
VLERIAHHAGKLHGLRSPLENQRAASNPLIHFAQPSPGKRRWLFVEDPN